MKEIRVEGLRKAYREQTVLNDVTFTVSEDQIACLMAPSGTGKTTLLRILLGLEQPDGGTVSLPQNCRWAAVFQEDRLLEQLDAVGNLKFVLGSALNEVEAKELLTELELEDVANKPVREYSGGMKRRLALAQALLAPSDAMVLDEPFAGLDEENRAKAIGCIQKRTDGKPVLLVTHDETDVQALGAKVIHL